MPTDQKIMARISTTNLPRQEAEQISDLLRAHHITGQTLDQGWLITTTQPLPDTVSASTPHLNYVLGFARAQGFDWVFFDFDAETVEELPQFLWN